MPLVRISTDGSGTSSGPGGWAAILRFGDIVREISGNVPEATNNRMELQAAIEALATLKRSCIVELTTDSEYLRNGATIHMHKWLRYGWTTVEHKPVKNRDLWERLALLMGRHSITWIHVKGHGDHVDNCRADELAGAERRKLVGEPVKKARKKAKAVAA